MGGTPWKQVDKIRMGLEASTSGNKTSTNAQFNGHVSPSSKELDRRLTRPLGFSRATHPRMCGHARRLQSNPGDYIVGSIGRRRTMVECVLDPRLLPESARLF